MLFTHICAALLRAIGLRLPLTIWMVRGLVMDEVNYKFVIINETDRPYGRHVAQVLSDGTARYLHHELRDWPAMGTDAATDIRAFSFHYEIRGNLVYFYRKSCDSVATYEDGTLRNWQGEASFSLSLWKEDKA